MEAFNVSTHEGRLFEAGSNLQDIAERLGQLVGNPLTIEGTDFELIAHSRQANDVDDVRKATVLQRRVPAPVVRALWSAGVVENVLNSRTPVRVEKLEAVGLSDRVAMAVRIGEEVVAHIWVQEANRPLDDNDMLLLQHGADMVALELLKIGYMRETKERMIANFLDELLVEGHMDEAEAQVRAARLGVSLPGAFRLIVVGVAAADDAGAGGRETAPPGRESELLQVAVDAANRYGMWNVATHHGHHAVMLVEAAEAERRAERNVAGIIIDSLVGRGRDALVCVSPPESRYRRIAPAFNEAMRCFRVAALLGWRNTVVTGASLGALQLLPPLAREYKEKFGPDVAHAGLVRLLEEDKNRSGFSLVETVEAFLDCGGDAGRTAKKLHIHVNTLNYRLRRIAERTGLDLTDGRERLALHLELKLRRLVDLEDAGK